jgi:hypothetical protein
LIVAENIDDKNNKDITTKSDSVVSLNEDKLNEIVTDRVKKAVASEISADKASLFTVFGVFASIVTLISVEIQMLKTLCSFWDVIGFSLILLAALLIFILLLDHIGRGWRDDSGKEQFKNLPWPILIICIVLFSVGIVLASKGSEQLCKDNMIYSRYKNDFDKRQIDMEKSFNDRINKLKDNLNIRGGKISFFNKGVKN